MSSEYVKRVEERAFASFTKNRKVAEKLTAELVNTYPITKLNNKITNRADKILSTQRFDYDVLPTCVPNIIDLKLRILDRS